ncbi:MAG: hypothetical protein U5L76_00575 [Patescibacteria group bacterium]|nr:hypothetical protein [Patescibacteria group bacterium]
MRISNLQKYILVNSYFSKSQKTNRSIFEDFYKNKRKKPKKRDIQNIITKSIERLIQKELLVGYGRRTPHMWFIEKVRLTSKGRKQVKKLLGQQQKLPFKIKKMRNG